MSSLYGCHIRHESIVHFCSYNNDFERTGSVCDVPLDMSWHTFFSSLQLLDKSQDILADLTHLVQAFDLFF